MCTASSRDRRGPGSRAAVRGVARRRAPTALQVLDAPQRARLARLANRNARVHPARLAVGARRISTIVMTTSDSSPIAMLGHPACPCVGRPATGSGWMRTVATTAAGCLAGRMSVRRIGVAERSTMVRVARKTPYTRTRQLRLRINARSDGSSGARRRQRGPPVSDPTEGRLVPAATSGSRIAVLCASLNGTVVHGRPSPPAAASRTAVPAARALRTGFVR